VPGLRSADFKRVLATPPRARSPHFALHHSSAQPGPRDLSTALDRPGAELVDECTRLGTVVPKRHARRAVTRNLLRRQIRAAAVRHAAALRQGCWVVRLKAPFDAARFPSAASAALRECARDELDALLCNAC
jgi:ribonuclease P protein component